MHSEFVSNISDQKKAHFIGICGVGMSATAILLQELGWEITGSDKGCHPPISDYLALKKIPVSLEYQPENIPPSVSLIVAGGSAKLNPSENTEVNAAHERGIPIKTFPELLGELSTQTENIIVAGSYGKSTCASLLAWCLRHAGKDPSYFIGALPTGMDVPARIGNSTIFVFEGDEYPTSGIDLRSKFLHLKTHDVLLISGEHDHVNIFKTEEEYLKPYRELLSRVPESGKIVACTDNGNVASLISPFREKVITYGLTAEGNPRWTAHEIAHGEITSFELLKSGKPIAHVRTSLLGDHNIQNIIGVGAMLLEKNLLTPDEFARAIEAFEGIKRRLDKKTKRSLVEVYEGFGSSYEKARAAIKAMVTHYPEKRLIVVFEPHSFSWRNRGMLYWYDDVFKECSKAFIYKPPLIGTENHDQTSLEEIIAQVQKGGTEAIPIETEAEGLHVLESELRPDDVVLLLTSGNLGGLVQSIPALVDKKFPRRAVPEYAKA